MLQSQRRRAGFPEIMPNKSMPVIDVDKRVCSVPLEKKEERKKKGGKNSCVLHCALYPSQSCHTASEFALVIDIAVSRV